MKWVCILSQVCCMLRGYACSWHTVLKQRTGEGFVEADGGRGRGAIGWREDGVHVETMGGGGGQEWWQYKSEIARWEQSQR